MTHIKKDLSPYSQDPQQRQNDTYSSPFSSDHSSHFSSPDSFTKGESLHGSQNHTKTSLSHPFGNLQGETEAFEKKFRAALLEASQEDQSKDPSHPSDQEKAEILLATLEPLGMIASPGLPTSVTPASPPLKVNLGEALQARVDTWVSTISLQIKAALEQTYGLDASTALTLQLDMGSEDSHLKGISIHFTPQELTVSLIFSSSIDRALLIQAAQNLALQLQERFTTRRIRILEAAPALESKEERPQEGLQALSDVFKGARN